MPLGVERILTGAITLIGRDRERLKAGGSLTDMLDCETMWMVEEWLECIQEWERRQDLARRAF